MNDPIRNYLKLLYLIWLQLQIIFYFGYLLVLIMVTELYNLKNIEKNHVSKCIFLNIFST